MKRVCQYPECTHRTSRATIGCKLHIFPSDHGKCRIWIRACKIAGTPRKLPAEIYICSCHFIGGHGPTKEHPYPVQFETQGSLSNPYKMKKFRTPTRTQKKCQIEVQAGEEDVEIDDPDPATDVAKLGDSEVQASSGGSCKTPVHNMGTISTADSNTPGGVFGTPHTPGISEGNGSTSSSNITPNTSSLSQAKDLDSFEYNFSSLPSSPVVTAEKKSLPLLSDLPHGVQGLGFKINKRQKKDTPSKSEAQAVPPVQCGLMESRGIGLQCDFPFFSYERSQQWSESDFQYFTGISKASFDVLMDLFNDEGLHQLKYKPKQATPTPRYCDTIHITRDKLFLTLVRLRRGFSLRDMRMLFSLSEASISNIFSTWIRLLSIKFESMEHATFVPAAAQEENKPECYRPFTNLRCVIDSFDIKVQKPTDMEQQCNTWSAYKSGNVLKFLVASSLYGGASFISKGFEGNISDRQLFLKSGMMNYLDPGDALMADRGFDIEADLNDIEVDFLCPPFLGNRESFTAREALLAKGIASSRIHVETFIGRVKFFRLIRYMVPNTMIDIAQDLVRVCVNLVNFSEPFIRWETTTNKKKVVL